MHVGEKPYVVTASSSMNAYRGPLAWGQVELSSRVLTFDAVSSMLGQILPADQQQALTEFGAIEHEIPSPVGVADRFTVVAARGGEDVWVELRRRPIEIPQAQAPAAEAPPTVAEPAGVAAEGAALPDRNGRSRSARCRPAASRSAIRPGRTSTSPPLRRQSKHRRLRRPRPTQSSTFRRSLSSPSRNSRRRPAGRRRHARHERIDRRRDSRAGRRRVHAQRRSGQRDPDRRR